MSSIPTSDAAEPRPGGAVTPTIWGDPEQQPALRRVLWRWLARASVAGLVISLAVHLVGGLVAARILVGVGGPPAGSGTPGGGPVELAIISDQELKGLDGSATLPDSPSPSTDASVADVEPSSLALPSGDAGGVERDLSASLPGAAGGGGDMGEGSGLGAGGPGTGGSGGGGTSFFGVEARGTRFLYVVDVSGSMGVGGKIEALKTQLLQSVESMTEGAQYFVIPFSQWANPLGEKKDWTPANESGKRFARRYIPALRPLDNTNPLPAFDIAFSIRPRPDAIYFMTDGQFDPGVADMIVEINRGLKIPIHCICFVSSESEALMKRIAKESGGTYTFIAGPGS
jgi:hypothetical protein